MVWMMAFQWLWTFGTVAGIQQEFPNPQIEFQLCGRRNVSFVCDPESILSVGDVEKLDQLAEDFRKSTNCLCSQCETGVSLGIFITSKLSPESATKYPNGRSVAEMVREKWHLGKCNDDIVVILLTEMNISDYSMGAAVKEIIPDATAELIITDCRAHFLSGWYYQGLESVITSFNDAFIKFQKKRKIVNKNLILGLAAGSCVLLLLLTMTILVLRRRNKRREKGCSNIYASVPTKKINEHLLNDEVSKSELEKLNKPRNNDDDEYEEDGEDAGTFAKTFLRVERQLSAVEEESEEGEALKDSNSFNSITYAPQSINHSLQVTEL